MPTFPSLIPEYHYVLPIRDHMPQQDRQVHHALVYQDLQDNNSYSKII